jgi:UDPglucose--hexose-1-phosphate uridylyltransferase
MKPEIRKDYVQEKYVIIAPQRGRRPVDIPSPVKRAPKSKICPFDPTHPKHQRGICSLTEKGECLCSPDPDIPWKIKVIPNRYPAVSLDNKRAYGQQEVVIETPVHSQKFEDLPHNHLADLFKVYAVRTLEITKNDKIQYVLIFKNQGGRAGASLEHAHSQIFATDFIPPHLVDKSQRTQRYKLEKGTCVYCDVIKQEQNGPRLIYKDSYVIAFCPFASMYNYEVWIMPIRHLDNITLLDDKERLSWAKVLKSILPKIVNLGLDYNYYFHQVVNDEDQHFYMKITPRGSTWAGVEIGSGVVINPVPPEEAGEYYRS